MKKKTLFVVVVFMMTSPFVVLGITPVHLGRVSIDTSLYDFDFRGSVGFVPGPFTEGRLYPGDNGNPQDENSPMAMGAFLKKNSNQYDIYSFIGKIGTTIVPILNDPDKRIYKITFSCEMLDNDASWETIVNYGVKDNNGTYNRLFKIFDDDGTELLADSGYARYGFDGNNTYVVTYYGGFDKFRIDSWRFRTNISSDSPKTLAKTKTMQSSSMQIYDLPGGDYRVTLTPSSGNQINFQMFDLLGRCVFDKQIENLNRPVSFTVPEGNIPNSPFIAKVNDGNSTIVKKQIPVK
jgi:hypothetical protein